VESDGSCPLALGVEMVLQEKAELVALRFPNGVDKERNMLIERMSL
jgi:hypothetical protein